MSITYIQLTPAELDAVVERAALLAVQKASKQHGDVLSLKDMANHFGVTTKTITNWENSGRIPARKNGYWSKGTVLETTQ